MSTHTQKKYLLCRLKHKIKIKLSLQSKKKKKMKYLNISSTNHDTIHLFEGDLSGFWHFILNKSKTFVFVGDWVPRQSHTFNWSERQKRLLDDVFFDFIVDTSNVYSENKLIEFGTLTFFG